MAKSTCCTPRRGSPGGVFFFVFLAVMVGLLQHHILHLHQAGLGAALVFVQLHGNIRIKKRLYLKCGSFIAEKLIACFCFFLWIREAVPVGEAGIYQTASWVAK